MITSPPPTSCPPGAGPTRRRLAAEWAHLAHRRSAVARASEWSLTDEVPRSLDDVLAAIGAGSSSAETEQRLRRLLQLARTDDLAARVIIERLVPGLMASARRRGRPDAFEELLAGLWIAIRTFNPDRRPSCLAVSLLADAEYHAYRRRQRQRSNDERPTEIDDRIADERPPHPIDELAELLGQARQAGMDPADVHLVRLLVAKPSTEDVAAELDVTSRTVRNRRDRVAQQLRELALSW
jgi:RNA polymerase sigma factor (sigma-70 family)